MADTEKISLTSLDTKEYQIAKIKELFPEVFTEGNKIDWDTLRLTLGENIDTGKERYGMTWPGKGDCFKAIQQPSIATLIPERNSSINFDCTENLFIEGDNLEALKLLQKSYLGKIKMIYIDPPYNTGNDFIYPDDYAENLDTYLEYTGQADSQGKRFSTNTETDGRFHSKWMNMMYPRLFLARNLLSDSGAIFISIDDNECDNLKKLCNEIYGENNFVGQLTIINNLKGRNDKKNIAQCHEYLLIYQKENFTSFGLPLTQEQLKAYKYTDERGEKYALRDLRKRGSGDRKEDRESMHFPIYYNIWTKELSLEKGANDDIEILPKRGDLTDGRWRWGKETVRKNIGILVPKYSKLKGRWDIDYRVYLNPSMNEDVSEEDLFESVNDADSQEIDNSEELVRTSKSKSFWNGPEISSDVGKRNFKTLFGNNADFPYPKSIEFLKRCIYMAAGPSDIVLDFFAGSCGIAEAVMEVNQLEGSDRKFICVQLPEAFDVSKTKNAEDRAISEKNTAFLLNIGRKANIAELGKERIIRSIQRIKLNNPDSQNLGFKAFRLGKSNFKVWDTSIPKEVESIQSALFDHVEHVSAESTQEAILYELLLKSGFELTTKINTIELGGKIIFSIADGELLICLEKELTNDVVRAIAELQPSRVICLDEGFSGKEADALKTNAVQIMKSKGVLNFRTV